MCIFSRCSCIWEHTLQKKVSNNKSILTRTTAALCWFWIRISCWRMTRVIPHLPPPLKPQDDLPGSRFVLMCFLLSKPSYLHPSPHYILSTYKQITQQGRQGSFLAQKVAWLSWIPSLLLGLHFKDRCCVYLSLILRDCQEFSKIITNGFEVSLTVSLSTPGLLNSARWASAHVYSILDSCPSPS